MISLLLLAILLVQIAAFVYARREARRLLLASLARTPAEYDELVRSGRS
jgi:hypothetical protein